MSNEIKRGRPALPFNLPGASRFTVNDCVAANPQIDCRLTIYTKLGKLTASRKIRLTGETVPSSGENSVGKPLAVYQTMTSYRISRALKARAKTRKNSTAPAEVTA